MCVSDYSSADMTTKPVLIFVIKVTYLFTGIFPSAFVCTHNFVKLNNKQTLIRILHLFTQITGIIFHHFWCQEQLNFLNLIQAKENHISYKKIVRNNLN